MFLEIALISKSNEKNKLVLATSFGNTNLKCNGEDESASVLKYGLKVDEKYHVNPRMMRLSSQENRWSDNYHTYEISRSPENIVFKIDGESYQLDTSDLPTDLIFDSEVMKLVIMNEHCIIILNFYSFSFIYRLVCQSAAC